MLIKTTVAWGKGVQRQFHLVFLLHLLSKTKYIDLLDVSDAIGEHVLGAPAPSTSFFLVSEGERKGWLYKTVVPRPQQSYVTSASDGLKHVSDSRDLLVSILDNSLEILDRWMLELFDTKVVPETNENGPADLFDHGGIHALTRTLMLHALANKHHRDPNSGEARSMYMFEFSRYLESFGWRSSVGVISKVKNEQDDDNHIQITLKKLVVPRKSKTMSQNVELLSLTEAGFARLQDDLIPTKAMLLRTQKILLSWKAFLQQMQ